MIKVEYMMGEKDKKTSDWVRVMSGYCGNGFGNYWLPEIGTEVLVGFIHGNMNMPVVLGCLWNGKDKLPEGTADEKNETKTVMTKGLQERRSHLEGEKRNLPYHRHKGSGEGRRQHRESRLRHRTVRRTAELEARRPELLADRKQR